MKYESTVVLVAILGLVAAAPTPGGRLAAREVPQEQSHLNITAVVNKSLKQNNPANITDAVFGMLGNAAAAKGAGSISNLDCLQQATADQAFTNAKAAGDVNGQVGALLYRALERNTGAVGLKSVLCNETAVNPEIQAITQHQDPASAGAAAANKAIVLALAQQIAAVGGDPTLALTTGTFAPGTIGDPTAAGHTCDVATDPVGCVYTQNLLVEDASVEEIQAAVANGAVSSSASVGAAASNSSAAVAAPVASANSSAVAAASSAAGLDFGSCSDPAIVFGAGFDGRKEDSFEPANKADFNHGSALKIAVVAEFISGQLSSKCKANAAAVAAAKSGSTAAEALTGQAAADAFNSALGVSAAAGKAKRAAANLQTFTGALGGAAPPVTDSGDAKRPFEVNGNTFVNKAAALQRSCAVQNTNCSNAANSKTLANTSVSQCNAQESACNAAAA